MLLTLLAFANLSAYIARNKTVDRIYEQDVAQKIDNALENYKITRIEFDHYAEDFLPPDANLLNYITFADESKSSDTNREEENDAF